MARKHPGYFAEGRPGLRRGARGSDLAVLTPVSPFPSIRLSDLINSTMPLTPLAALSLQTRQRKKGNQLETRLSLFIVPSDCNGIR